MDEIEYDYTVYDDWKVFIYSNEGWIYRELYQGDTIRRESFHITSRQGKEILDHKDWICGEGIYG
jgi:hypothetical protein